jgi:dienelactone hydrolase
MAWRVAACLLMAALAGAAGGAHALGRPAWARDSRATPVPVHEASGTLARMVVTVFRPKGRGPFPVVVFSHGRDPSPAGRARLALGVSRAQVVFWLARGVAVVAPVRPGYGASGGADVEDTGSHFDRTGQCIGRPDFRKAADAAALSVAATLDWLRGQPWADSGTVLLAGESVGGLATVAAGAQALPGVVGTINFAGGNGGNAERSRGASCDPEQLAALYADYGRSTTVPNLWFYALNDEFWGAAEPRDWHAAFARGGSPTTFVQAPALPAGDGHELSRYTPRLWAPVVDEFLARLGTPWNAATTPRPVLRLDAGKF